MSTGIPRLRRCAVLGGNGAVGSMFTRLLRESGADVCIIDTVAPAGPAARFVHADITAPCAPVIKEVAASDLVLLAVPEAVALSALPLIARAVSKDALLADTLSVKSRIAAAVREYAPRAQAVSVNPMFAPSLGLAGRAVATVVLRGGPRVEEFLSLLMAHDARIVRLSPDRHDRVVAATQALTHATVLAFGLALGELGLTADELCAMAPPPHTLMLALLARITAGTPEVYWDVQAANPFAATAREALAGAAGDLLGLCDDKAAFTVSLVSAAQILGRRLADYQALCARIFKDMPSPDGPAGDPLPNAGPDDPSA